MVHDRLPTMGTIDISQSVLTPPASPTSTSTFASASASASRKHRRQSSITLRQLPPQILLPLINRPAELTALLKHNSQFFTLLERAIGQHVYHSHLLPLFAADRAEVDDLSLLVAVHRMLCVDSESSNSLWAEFCRIVGFEDPDSSLLHLSRSSSRSSASDCSCPVSAIDSSDASDPVSLRRYSAACIVEDDEN
ncbi:uncharacterized protein V2V93DRAFT_374595 [Kockiozyma suomiensis]|uniref:uncharacterized protein n=1 Tax=Kockiozyma suomiensis TaxID=1337062 RepID=UPI00334378BD